MKASERERPDDAGKRPDVHAEPEPRDRVDEASEQSFPASDPPSWASLHSGAPDPNVGARRGRTGRADHDGRADGA